MPRPRQNIPREITLTWQEWPRAVGPGRAKGTNKRVLSLCPLSGHAGLPAAQARTRASTYLKSTALAGCTLRILLPSSTLCSSGPVTGYKGGL